MTSFVTVVIAYAFGVYNHVGLALKCEPCKLLRSSFNLCFYLIRYSGFVESISIQHGLAYFSRFPCNSETYQYPFPCKLIKHNLRFFSHSSILSLLLIYDKPLIHCSCHISYRWKSLKMQELA